MCRLVCASPPSHRVLGSQFAPFLLSPQIPSADEAVLVATERRDTLMRCRLAGMLNDQKTSEILELIRAALPSDEQVSSVMVPSSASCPLSTVTWVQCVRGGILFWQEMLKDMIKLVNTDLFRN